MRWIIPLAACTFALPGGCQSPAKPFAAKYADVHQYMSRDEVKAVLGPPAKTRTMTFPEGPFMGPQEGLTGTVDPGQPLEEWEYTSSGEVFLIFFAGADAQAHPDEWTVVGKTNFPQGAAF